MARSLEDRRLRRRIEQLGQDIVRIREQSAGARDKSVDASEVAELASRHEELHRRLAELEALADPEDQIVNSFEADFDGLMRSINDWIARQDAKTTRH